jgi:DNA adenine methylase
MSKYNCEKCGKEFNQKSHYTKHFNKKIPCVTESKIKEIIDVAVTEKIIELQNTFITTPENPQPPTPLSSAGSVTLVKHISTTKIHTPKPILKWVGGKTQIMDTLIADFPTEIHNYHEAFLGGGSVLLSVLSYAKNGVIKIHGNIHAYDLNAPLIHIYINIQTQHNELYATIQNIIMAFNGCGNGEINRTPANIEEAKTAKENYYYWIRSEYNRLSPIDKTGVFGSAMFIFLNKTCFRGVFRVGPKGFNVPYGHYNNPEIINKEHLDEIHELIQPVIFECCDFTKSLANVGPQDFVYLDPPYAPETDTSFVGYTENGFSIDQHNRLFRCIHTLTDANKKVMLSNADVNLVRENFTSLKYNTLSIMCKRSIHSKTPDAKAKEVIIRNY